MTGASERVINTATLTLRAVVESTVPWWPPTVVEWLQRRRIESLVRHAYATVPFYTEAMRSRGLHPWDITRADDLARLPLIDDEIVQANFDSFVSTACPPEQRTALLTSGSSSGVRRLILWDRAALLRKAARAQRDRGVLAHLAEERTLTTALRELTGRPNDGTHNRLSILPLDATSATGRSMLSSATLVARSAGHYSLVSPAAGHEAAADALERLRPRIVFSFGSYVEEFLSYLDSSGRDSPLPRVWVYLGDGVGPRGRALAASRRCLLYSVYASTEGGAIGFQCEHREGFHLNVDLCAVRVTDERGAKVAAGEVGEVVISNLANRAMVLLNYRQRDRGTLSALRCGCGRRLPLLAELHGRASEVVELRDGRRLSELELEGLFRHELRAVAQCQLVHPAPGVLTWRLIPRPGADRGQMREAILTRGRIVLGADTRIDVTFPDALNRGPSGKLLRVAHEGG